MALFQLTEEGGAKVARPGSEGGTINVVRHLERWTANGSASYPIKVPEVRMKEYEILQSSLITQAKYSVAVAAGSFDKIKDLVPDGLKKFIKDVMSKGSIPSSDDPFEGLYDRTPTGFTYILPYFNSGPAFTKTADFSEAYSGDGMIDAVSNVYDAAAKVTSFFQGIRSLTEPGIFLVKPRFYNPTSSSQTVNFTFPLLNTFSEKDIKFNYDLTWLLLFQNCIKRIDRGAYIPPCIYEVTVPGLVYMKFGYVESISVDLAGTRRSMKVGNDRTIIPEAYNITISLKQLTTDVAEFYDRV